MTLEFLDFFAGVSIVFLINLLHELLQSPHLSRWGLLWPVLKSSKAGEEALKWLHRTLVCTINYRVHKSSFQIFGIKDTS